MRGSIRRRGAGWELRVYLGRDPVSGRQRYASRTVQGPRSRADRELRDMVAAAEAGVTHHAGATFGGLCEAWLAAARPQLAANTVVETRRILDSVLLPALGGVRLAELRAEHLDELYARLLRGGGANGKPLSGSSVPRVHGVARRALTVGVGWGWMTTNPALVAMPPRAIARPIQAPSPAQVRQLVAAAGEADPALACFVYLAVATGARRGELCGLRWRDVDTAEGRLDIVRSIIVVDGQCVEAPTKTRQSRRIALDAATCAVLDARRRELDQRAAADQGDLVRDAFVFSHDDGRRPWRPDSATRAFRALCHRIGLDGVRLHDLRHFAATRLLTSGIDLRTVAGRLGHSKASTTLDVYASFVPDADQRAAESLSQLLDPTSDETGTPGAAAYPVERVANLGGVRMSDNAANHPSVPSTPLTIAEIVRDLEPMGDLGRFLIDDMTPDEEDVFFAALEDA